MPATKVELSNQVKGNLPITHFNSGTGASASTYWRGDGQWSAGTSTDGTKVPIVMANNTSANSVFGGVNYLSGAYFNVTGKDYANFPGKGSAEFVIGNDIGAAGIKSVFKIVSQDYYGGFTDVLSIEGNSKSSTFSGTVSATNLSGTNTGDQTLNSILPTQIGNSSKILQTDGSNASWQNITGDDNIEGQAVYVMTCHRNIEQKMYTFISGDGINFSMVGIKNSYAPPSSGVLRDPSLIYTNNKYYVAYTNNDGTPVSTSFAIASSPDLITWTFERNVSCSGISGVNKIWAPQFYQDSDNTINVIVSGSTNSGTTFQTYLLSATASDLSTFGSPVLLTITGKTNVIDAEIVKVGSTYNMFYKEETTKFIEKATSSTLTGTYTPVGTGNWAGWGADIEAPEIVKISSTKYRIYFDKYTQQGIYYSDSADLVTWSAKQLINTDKFTASHISVQKFTSIVPLRNAVLSLLSTKIKNVSLEYYQSTAQSIATTATKVLFQTKITDVSSNFNSSTFTAPYYGKFCVSGFVHLASSVNGAILILYKKGVLNKVIYETGAFASATDLTFNFSCNVSCMTGDTLEIYAMAKTAARNTVAGINDTVISIDQIN